MDRRGSFVAGADTTVARKPAAAIAVAAKPGAAAVVAARELVDNLRTETVLLASSVT